MLSLYCFLKSNFIRPVTIKIISLKLLEDHQAQSQRTGLQDRGEKIKISLNPRLGIRWTFNLLRFSGYDNKLLTLLFE